MDNRYLMADEEEQKLKDSLTPGTSEQIPPVTQPDLPIAPQAPIAQKTPNPMAVPSQSPVKLPGMPPSVTPDEISTYVNGQKSNINKFGPQQQVDLENNLLAQRNSLGNRLKSGAKGFADALMMGVAQAGDPGFQQQFENRQDEQSREKMDVLQKAHGQQLQDVESGMKLDMTDPNSSVSKAYRDSFSPIFSKMGYSPKSIAKMSASQVSTVADLGVRFADAQTQLELKKAMLGVESYKAGADIQNQKSQRKLEAVKQLKEMPWYSRALHPGVSGALSEEAGLDSTPALSHPQASEAMDWAKSNPTDPRSMKILKRLGH